MLRDPKTEYFNLLDNFNVGLALIAFYVLSFFACLALFLLLNELSHRVRFADGREVEISKRMAMAFGKFRNKTLSAVALFVLFVCQFLWFTQLLLTNNIKVEV